MSPESVMEAERVEEVLVSHLKECNIAQSGPRLWTIRESSLGGRGMFAARDIERNQLIFIDSPLIIGPRRVGEQLQMCSCCYKKECPLFPCDRGCGLPVCSTECENSPRHMNHECEYLRSLIPTCGTDWSSDLLRALIAIRATFLTERQRECLAALQCVQTVTSSYDIELLEKNVTNPPSEKDVGLMKRVCGAFSTNAFETVSVYDKDRSSSLRGLYPMGSLQNHCCVPNTRHHFDGEYRLYVAAVMPIPAGEEITMSYTSLFWDTISRRKFLSITKQFSCTCKRCGDVTEFGSRLGAFLCATDGCSGQLLPRDPLKTSPWVCDRCSTTINHRQMCSIRSGIAAIMEEVQYKTPRQIFKFIQKELSVLVPRSNCIVIDAKFRIISYYGRSEGLAWEDLTDTELDVKIKYCNDLLFVLDTLKCGDCKKRGLILYELYCTNLEKMKRLKQQSGTEKIDENQHLLQKALIILQNDIVSAVTFEYDRKYFKQPIAVQKIT